MALDPPTPHEGFSDYIIFVDESGDHGLNGIDPDFPMFALSFCLIAKTSYAQQIVPAFQEFKFEMWGHDGAILHEHEIRKNKGPFGILRTNPVLREKFYERLNGLMADAPMFVIASVINKANLKNKYSNPWSPYELALLFCMERGLRWLLKNNQAGKLTHIIFESRGKKEDSELELEFRRICDNKGSFSNDDFTQMQFEPVFISKASNSIGLQLADLTARPIALRHYKPLQSNRAYEIIHPKLVEVKLFP